MFKAFEKIELDHQMASYVRWAKDKQKLGDKISDGLTSYLKPFNKRPPPTPTDPFAISDLTHIPTWKNEAGIEFTGLFSTIFYFDETKEAVQIVPDLLTPTDINFTFQFFF